MKTEFPICPLCDTLEVSPSGFNDWLHRQSQPSIRAQQDAVLGPIIEQIFQDSQDKLKETVITSTPQSHEGERSHCGPLAP